MVKETTRKISLNCVWCNHEFETVLYFSGSDRSQIVCPKCNRIIPSSKKIKEGASHRHEEWTRNNQLKSIRVIPTQEILKKRK